MDYALRAAIPSSVADIAQAAKVATLKSIMDLKDLHPGSILRHIRWGLEEAFRLHCAMPIPNVDELYGFEIASREHLRESEARSFRLGH